MACFNGAPNVSIALRLRLRCLWLPFKYSNGMVWGCKDGLRIRVDVALPRWRRFNTSIFSLSNCSFLYSRSCSFSFSSRCISSCISPSPVASGSVQDNTGSPVSSWGRSPDSVVRTALVHPRLAIRSIGYNVVDEYRLSSRQRVAAI